MPCRDYPTDDTPYEKNLKERCDYLARTACKFAEQLSQAYGIIYTTAGSKEIDDAIRLAVGKQAFNWWKQHQKDDALAEKRKRDLREVIHLEYKRDKEHREEQLKAYKAALRALGPDHLRTLNIREPAKIDSLNKRLRKAGLPPTDNG